MLLLLKSKKLKTKEELGAHASQAKGHTARGQPNDDDDDINTRAMWKEKRFMSSFTKRDTHTDKQWDRPTKGAVSQDKTTCCIFQHKFAKVPTLFSHSWPLGAGAGCGAMRLAQVVCQNYMLKHQHEEGSVARFYFLFHFMFFFALLC